MRSASSNAARSRSRYSANSSSRVEHRVGRRPGSRRPRRTPRRARRASRRSPSAGSGGGALDAVEQVPVVVEHLGHRARDASASRSTASRTSIVDSSSGSSSSSSTNARHRASNATRDEISSRTSMRGGKPALDRELGEDALRERVQRADRGARRDRRAPLAAGPHDVGLSASSARRRSSRADAVAQLGRGLLGEGDRGDRAIGTGASVPSASRARRPGRRAPSSCRCPRRPRRTASRRARCGSRRARARRRARRRARAGRSRVGLGRSSALRQAAEPVELGRVALALPLAPAVGRAHAVGIAVVARR